MGRERGVKCRESPRAAATDEYLEAIERVRRAAHGAGYAMERRVSRYGAVYILTDTETRREVHRYVYLGAVQAFLRRIGVEA